MSDLITTLIDLIDIPSVIGDEGRLCTSLSERLMETWGIDGVERLGNSLIVGKRSQRPLVLLVGHIDTVPAQGQGPARLEEGRVTGLGASDMKSGLAVMLHLLEDPAVRLGPYDVVGLFYDREEGPVDENGLEPVLRRAPGWPKPTSRLFSNLRTSRCRSVALGRSMPPCDLRVIRPTALARGSVRTRSPKLEPGWPNCTVDSQRASSSTAWSSRKSCRSQLPRGE